MKKRKVLLLGNGINRIDNDYAWDDLMDDLLAYVGLQHAISPDGKPFPLLYEEMYLRWQDREDASELDLKNKIRQLLRLIRSNDLHREAMSLPVDEIMTTNYDYNLEATLKGGLRAARYIPPVKGNKYSLLRRRQAGDKVLWHIHGETAAPGTILLGYEQYAGYLQNIRNYMMVGMRYKDFELPALHQRLKTGSREVRSWVDHFFLNDVYILGLNMDFVEMHLWWILDYRARLIQNERIHIDNKLIFLYPSHETSWIKSRIDLLCACNVGCLAVPVVDGNWKEMYRSAMKYIREAVAL